MRYLRDITGSITAILLLLTVFTPGCSTWTVEKQPLPNIIWPKPPEIPRIRFVNTISKTQDLRISETVIKKFFRYMKGQTETSIVAPHGLEVDSAGRLYVVDTFLKKVHVYDTKGNRYYTFPNQGTTFSSPIDLAIDNKGGHIYVTDSTAAVVKIFKNNGTEFVGEIKNRAIGRPTGIAINEKTNELLVLDTTKANILIFDLADYHLKGIIGSDGNAAGKFHYPTNIFVSGDGSIIVSDSLNFRIQVFAPDGEFITAFGEAGQSPGYFSRPKGVAVDSDGNIYVVDSLFDNIQIFDNQGRLLMAFGGPGQGYGEFWLPTGIFIDKKDTIYVSDTYNKRVQVFQYMKGEAL